MENSLRIFFCCCLKLALQPFYDLCNCVVHSFIFRQFRTGKDKENMKLAAFRYDLRQCMLLQPPGFPHQSFYTLTVNRMTELFLGHGKTCQYRRCFYFNLWNCQVNNLQRENRKRLSFTEKRINMLFALKPLVCF
jgi:hypothetical protein